MKLAILSYYYPPDQTPGSFRVASFIKSLEKRINVNDEIRVFTTTPNRYSSYSIQASNEEVRNNITIERIWLPKHNNKVFFQIVGFLNFGFQTIRRMRRNRPDYIICTTGRHMTSLLAYICSLIYGVRYYVDFRDIFSEGLSQTYGERSKFLGIILKKFFLSLEKIVLKNASGINVVSQAFLPYYQEEGLDTSDWVFHPNGVDKNFLELDVAPKRSKKEIKTILYAGNIGKGQGLERIIPDVAKRLGNNFSFVIIGDGVCKNKLKDRIKKFNLENVIMKDPIKRESLIEEYLEADMLFLQLDKMPAFERSLPSKIFEYAVTGKPIIAGLSGYSRKFLNDNIPHALLFNPGSINECCDAIKAASDISVDFKSIQAFKKEYSRESIMDKLSIEILRQA